MVTNLRAVRTGTGYLIYEGDKALGTLLPTETKRGKKFAAGFNFTQKPRAERRRLRSLMNRMLPRWRRLEALGLISDVRTTWTEPNT